MNQSLTDGVPADIVTVDINGPAHGGTVVARLGAETGERSGQVVFIRGALPGETGVRVRLDTTAAPGRHRRFLTGSVIDSAQIGEVSPHRVDPVCPAAAAGAGCCDLDMIDASGSMEWKRQVVVDQFNRIGHLDLSDVQIDAVSPGPFAGYRTRIRLGVDSDGTAGLRMRNSHGIVPVSTATCAQWAPALAEGLAEELEAAELTPGAQICVALGDDGRRSMVELSTSTESRQGNRHSRGRRDNRRRNGATRRRTRRRVLTGEGTVLHRVNGVEWTVPAEAFWQAHESAPELYSRWIMDTLGGSFESAARADSVASGTNGASGTSDDSVSAWDLYGGAGVFAAAMTEALPGVRVDSVDVASEASAAGRAALGGRPVRFVDGDVATTLNALDPTEGTAHELVAVVLDPPRTGAGDHVLDAVATRRPGHVLHIGCDPATAARDARTLTETGYRLNSLTVVDAFGLTHHVEVLAHFTPTSETPSADDHEDKTVPRP